MPVVPGQRQVEVAAGDPAAVAWPAAGTASHRRPAGGRRCRQTLSRDRVRDDRARPRPARRASARPESIAGTTTRPTTSPTTNAPATVSSPNAVLPASATAKTRGSSRMARQIRPRPVPSTPAANPDTSPSVTTLGTPAPYTPSADDAGVRRHNWVPSACDQVRRRRAGRPGRPHAAARARRPDAVRGLATRDLAAHLVLRNNRPDAAAGHRDQGAGRPHPAGPGPHRGPTLAGAAGPASGGARGGRCSARRRSTGPSTSSTTRTSAGRSPSGGRATYPGAQAAALWGRVRGAGEAGAAQGAGRGDGDGAWARLGHRRAGWPPVTLAANPASCCCSSPAARPRPGGADRTGNDHRAHAAQPVRRVDGPAVTQRSGYERRPGWVSIDRPRCGTAISYAPSSGRRSAGRSR